MNIALWVVQALVAVAYLLSGGMKVTQPIERLSASMTFVNVLPHWMTRFIGAAEVLGAIGLILPLATNILPWLTIAAAIGLLTIQILAIGYHLSHHDDPKRLPVNVILLLLALFIAFGRIAWVPIA